jgi:hypothetical protein
MIDKRKILTISAGDYFKMQDTEAHNYTPVGVQAYAATYEITGKFSEEVPKNAEAVVDYKVTSVAINSGGTSSFSSISYAAGTALIRKNSLENQVKK